MTERKKILYVQTSGVNTPLRLYSPFVLGMTARAMDIEATIYFLGEGVTVVKKGAAEKVKEGSFLFDFNGDEEGFVYRESAGQPLGMIDPIAQYDHSEGIHSTGEISEAMGLAPSEVSRYMNSSTRQGLAKFDINQKRFVPA